MKTENNRVGKAQNAARENVETNPNQEPRRQPSASVIKVKSKIKAGYYLSFTIGAGASSPSYS